MCAPFICMNHCQVRASSTFVVFLAGRESSWLCLGLSCLTSFRVKHACWGIWSTSHSHTELLNVRKNREWRPLQSVLRSLTTFISLPASVFFFWLTIKGDEKKWNSSALTCVNAPVGHLSTLNSPCKNEPLFIFKGSVSMRKLYQII